MIVMVVNCSHVMASHDAPYLDDNVRCQCVRACVWHWKLCGNSRKVVYEVGLFLHSLSLLGTLMLFYLVSIALNHYSQLPGFWGVIANCDC